jgi:hypothetical protein
MRPEAVQRRTPMLGFPEPQPAVHTFPDTGHSVRTVIRDGEPWWVASDVCAVLGYSRVADALRDRLGCGKQLPTAAPAA